MIPSYSLFISVIFYTHKLRTIKTINDNHGDDYNVDDKDSIICILSHTPQWHLCKCMEVRNVAEEMDLMRHIDLAMQKEGVDSIDDALLKQAGGAVVWMLLTG